MQSRKAKFLLMLVTSLVVMGFSAIAFAQGDAPANAETVEAASKAAGGWIAIGAGLAIALAAFGGALGQGRAASTALEGIARNPGAADKLFTPMILGLALIESLVIYALIIAFLLQAKIG
jgi:F-type H+-transporting ATPase subunit c